MKLRVDDITAQSRELVFFEPEAAINRVLERGRLREYRILGPIEVRVSYYRAGMDVFFQGDLNSRLTAVCARCAEEFEAASRRPFRFVVTPQVAGDKVTGGLGSEDLELSTYSGEEIDLSPLLHEQMLLALPTRPLCGEECRGLCPKCGGNLNTAACACAQESFDPRLAVLRSLKSSRS